MNKRQAKKQERECIKHGYYAWIKLNTRKANAMVENCCLRNNWRKYNKLPMFRLARSHLRTIK